MNSISELLSKNMLQNRSIYRRKKKTIMNCMYSCSPKKMFYKISQFMVEKQKLNSMYSCSPKICFRIALCTSSRNKNNNEVCVKFFTRSILQNSSFQSRGKKHYNEIFVQLFTTYVLQNCSICSRKKKCHQKYTTELIS